MTAYPKWLFKDWMHTPDKAPGHHVAKESKLVQTEEEAKELLAKGWTTEAPKAAPKPTPKEK